MLSKVISKTKIAFFTASLLAIFSSCSQEGDTSSSPIATTGDVTVSTGSRLSSIPDLEWPLHNFNLYGSRSAPTDQITPENVGTLTPTWLFQHGVIDGVSNQTTPVIVDGIMYITDSRGSVYAVDARNGHLIWSYDITLSSTTAQ